MYDGAQHGCVCPSHMKEFLHGLPGVSISPTSLRFIWESLACLVFAARCAGKWASGRGGPTKPKKKPDFLPIKAPPWGSVSAWQH
ncbi:hypothetical protein SKAU_G00006540 [Synaphobranchus kaupii]|uniref:Uncharacterized protein n=1 Tax=Synaphobranchus kaupii TaxID=118154 RepID=A0A9Q1G981_SYNKA|nr:hypothetical protein SKAU_G00006540 [Synaphobranchus kaupii]